MAIKDENTTTLGAALNNAGVGNKQPQNGNTNTTTDNSATFNTNPSTQSRGFSSLGGDVDIVIPLNNTSETLGKFQRAMQEVINSYRQDTSKVETTLIPVDKNDGLNNVPVSYLIVATQLRSNRDAGVGYQALLLEGSIDSIPVTEEYVPGAPGGKVQVHRTAMDADQPSVRATIDDIVKKRFQTNNVFAAIAMVVPRDTTDNLTDVQRVKSLAARATYNAAVALQLSTGTLAKLNLKDFVGGSDALQAKLSFDPQPVYDLFNHPVRSDIKLQLISEPINKTTVPGFGNSGATLIATTSAFVEPIYQPKVPSSAIAGLPSFGQPTPDSYRKFIPRVVLTMLRSERLMTIGGQMLALASAIAIRDRQLWMAAFLPQRNVSPNEIDLRDVGALNTEVNFGGDPNAQGVPLDTKADNFSTPALMGYLKAIFHEGNPVFAIDVSLRGPDTAYNGVLAAADDGDPIAIKAILNDINQLTNGAFQKRWKEGTSITLQKGENVHLGYFKKANGEMVDLRTLDYTAVANLVGTKDPQLLRDFSDTFLKTSYPEAQRMAARLDILRRLAPDLVVTGTARRVSLTGVFVDTLVDSIADVGAAMPLTGSTFLDTSTADRATGDFAAGLSSGNNSPLYTRTFSTGQNAGLTGGTQYAGAWGNR